MKKFLLAIISLSVFAANADIRRNILIANTFSCVGLGDSTTTFTYNSTSKLGRAMANLKVNGSVINVIEGQRPSTEFGKPTYSMNKSSTVHGEMVTVSVSKPYIADYATVRYSMLVPYIALSDETKSVEYTSAHIVGHTGGFMRPYDIQTNLSSVEELKCVGNFNYF